ncbi:MAG: PAS domain-containing protein [Desulfobacula sp.]|nr:PAS domain-containing protein [Desulfobacula sp.]
MILIILSLIAFFSAWTGGYLYYSAIKNSAFEEANDQAVFHTETIKSHLSYFLEENLNSVRALAGLEELSNALSKRDQESLVKTNSILDHFKKTFQADICYLIDHNGNTIASSNRNAPDSFVGQNYSFRPYFKQAIKADPSVYFGYMALGVTSGKRGIYYSHPVYEDKQETPIGVAVIKTSIEPMEREFKKKFNGIVMFTDPHGIVFITNHHEWILHTFSKLSSKEISRIKNYRQFGQGPWHWTGLKVIDEVHAIDSLSNKYLFHKIALDNYPGWNLIFLSDIKSILKRVHKPFIRIIGYLVTVLCVFIGLTVFILYNKANHEINQRIKAEKALIKAHRGLEQRVQKRTAEIRESVDDLKKEIVERKRVEEALRGSEEKYRTLTNNLSVGVFRTTPGPKGNYIEINSSFMRIFGFNNKEVLLSLYTNTLYQNPKDRDIFSNKMLKDGHVKNEVFMYKKRDGTPFCGSVTAVAVKDDHGKVSHYDGILEDITELRQIKEEAQKRREEIVHLGRVTTMGELSASLAHELNQPLAAILTNAQAGLRFIDTDSPDLDEIRDIFNDIVADDRRAGQVIHRLRSLFRKGEFEKVSIDINDIVQEVVSLIHTEAMIRTVSIEYILDRSIAPVLGDKIHLQQVIINFILNASEAMEDIEEGPRKIIISTGKTDDNMVKVSVCDNGIGFDKDNIDDLIEPFYSTKSGGMGMGLSINRTIIKAHLGQIWAVNNHDRGATFYFTLPIDDEA